MIKKLISLIILISGFYIPAKIAFCGTDLNKWEVFTDQKNIVGIAVIENKYGFFVTSGGMYSVDLTNGNILKKYTNIDGLLANDLTSIKVDNQKRLWIGASDGSVCILNFTNGEWKYIYDIRNSNENNKSINSFEIFNNFIFIATGYGIHKVSLSNLNFIDAPYYQFGNFPSKTKVNDLAISNNKIFAATASGISYADLLNSNLNNPASWTIYNNAPMSSNVQVIEPFFNNIFAGSSFGFSFFDGNTWNYYPNPQVNTTNIKSIKTIGNLIYFISNNNIYFAESGSLANITNFLEPGNYNCLFSDDQNLIVGTNERGAYIKRGNNYELIYPNCPNRNIFDFVTTDNSGILWATAGTGEGGYYSFDGTAWSTFTNAIYPQLGNSNLFKEIIPGNSGYWVTSFGSGPTYVSGTNMVNYNAQNSNLPGIIGDSNFCVSQSGAFDLNGKFWLTFYQSNSGSNLYSFKGDFDWNQYPNPNIIGNGRFIDMAIDNYNTKWIAALTPPGVYFFNENGTDPIFSDDIYGFYPTGELTSVNEITDIIVDKNNEVWIATDNGIFIISNPYLAIQDPTRKPAPVKLGIISGNLRVPFTENCRCIFSDVLNEKWVGTQSNGVFHLSQDGATLIEQFNKANSPLLDNQINSITVNRKTGKAYFGTLRGLYSYQTYSIEPVEDFDKIICMPNPYVIPSNVNLKIDGLIENSTVKIMNLKGEVINEFDSPGGRIASWNGLNSKGEPVPTGIYIIVAFNKDATKVGKGKLAIIRK